MLSIARVIGETAPLLIVAGFTTSMNYNLVHRPDDDPAGVRLHPVREPGHRTPRRTSTAPGPARSSSSSSSCCSTSSPASSRRSSPPSSAAEPERRNPCPSASKSNDLNVYYGNFKAVEDVSLTIEPRTVTAFIGPSGCGKSTFLRTLNRMHEVIPGALRRGRGATSTATTCTARASTRCSCAARWAWCSSAPTRSRRCRSATTCSPGVQAQQPPDVEDEADELVEKSLQGANLWNEVKDRLDAPGLRPLRRPAAAPLHRARDRGLARGAS